MANRQRKSLDFIKTKRGNSKFTTLEQSAVLKAARSYAERRSKIKRELGVILPAASETQLKKDLQAGMTKNEFLSKYGVIVAEGYKDTAGNIKVMDVKITPTEQKYAKELGKARFDIYGKDVYDKFERSLEAAKQHGIKEIKLDDVVLSLDTASLVEHVEYNPYELEKVSILLDSLSKGETTEQLIDRGLKEKKERRYKELLEHTEQLIEEKRKKFERSGQDVDDMIAELATLSREDLLKRYIALIGNEYKDNDNDYHAPSYYNVDVDKIKDKHGLGFYSSKNEVFRDSVLSELTDTDYYVDNYFRALENQDDIKHSRTIMSLLNTIDKDKLKDFLLEDEMKLDKWYNTDDSAFDKSREYTLVDNIRNLYDSEYGKSYFKFKTKGEKNKFERTLNELYGKLS